MALPFTSSHLLFPFLLYLSFTSSAFSDQLPSSFASTQIKLWSEHVNNKMPAAISTKLSPLTKQDSEYYSRAISQNNFKADTKFCSLAKLACSSAVDTSKVGRLFGAIQCAYKKAGNIVPLEKFDPFTFFRLSSLREGYTIHLPDLKESLPFRSYLPPQITSKISLSQKEITKIFPELSKEVIDMTLSCCNAKMKGETKACLKSLEEMISFSKTALGKSKLLALNSKSMTGSGEELTVKKIKQFNVEKLVACHEMFLPFATYSCHLASSSRIYSVDFEPKTGAQVSTALAICHMDTSDWPEKHEAFKLLKFGPGQGEACHWMNEIDLAWIDGVENI